MEVKRDAGKCIVQCRISPEQRIRTKLNKVTAHIDEENETVLDVHCHDCKASEGGCKHSLCFLMWLVKKTEEPSSTSTSCYWNRPRLTEAVTKDKFITALEFGKKRKLPRVPSVPDLHAFIAECKKHDMSDSLIVLYNDEKATLNDFCIFNMMLNFVNNNDNTDLSYQNFKTHARSTLTNSVIDEIEEKTQNQVDNKLWHSMRQSRITASKIFEVSRCKTSDGALVQSILGGYKVPETAAIKRGKRLESDVIKQVEKDLNICVRKCGFFIVSPIMGASPDGICDDYVIEVKCPAKEMALKNYITKDGLICDKFKSQINLQMHATNKKKGLFCIASPKFEENKKVSVYWVHYDKTYIENVITAAESFWIQNIFPKILESVK